MKETGVVRRLDELGRVVIPKEIRKRLKIKNGDMVDIYTDNEYIILQKYHPLNQDILPIKGILEALSKEYEIDFILFDDTRIIYSTLSDVSSSDEVDSEFIKKASVYLEKEVSSKQNIHIVSGKHFDKDMYIEKISVNFEEFGYIAVLDHIIGKKHKEAVSIICRYFNQILGN